MYKNNKKIIVLKTLCIIFLNEIGKRFNKIENDDKCADNGLTNFENKIGWYDKLVYFNSLTFWSIFNSVCLRNFGIKYLGDEFKKLFQDKTYKKYIIIITVDSKTPYSNTFICI